MTDPRNPGIYLITLVLGLIVAIWVDASRAEISSSDIKLELNSGLLTLETHEASLSEVLYEIGELAGFKTIRLADPTEIPLISLSFVNRPVREGVERLVDNTSSIIFYSQDESQHRKITQIWLLGSSESSGNIGANSEMQNIEIVDQLQADNANSRSEAVLRLSQQQDKSQVLQHLTRMLHQDPDPLVRVRAAIAIGAFGEEDSIISLELALLDEHASVRSQTITALGQIGGEKAVTILGNILLDSSISQLDRIVAAQALWKQDSKAAIDFLRTASNDADEQVRLASSKAPSPPTAQGSIKQFNSEELE